MACTCEVTTIRHFNAVLIYFLQQQQSSILSCIKTVSYNSLNFSNYLILHTTIHSPHSNPKRSGIGGLWYCGEGHLLGTLHPTRPGPNLFYVSEE